MSEKFKALVINQEGENFTREVKSIEKTFLKPAQRFKMESKRVFRILNHFRPTLPHIKCPGKSIFVLNWNKNLERIVMFLETERCESGLISTLGKRVV